MYNDIILFDGLSSRENVYISTKKILSLLKNVFSSCKSKIHKNLINTREAHACKDILCRKKNLLGITSQTLQNLHS